MTEPHSSVASGALTGAGISTVTIFLGAQVDALVIGLTAAVFVSIWLQTIDNKIKAAAAVIFSAMLAGYGSPVVAAWASNNLANPAISIDSLRVLFALMIGAVTPTLFPLALKALGRKVDGEKP
jgi:hypothetical protein